MTTRNWSRDAGLFPDQGPQTKTPVVCLNDAWHPLAPRFAGDRHATLFCHGDCLDGETISLIVRRGDQRAGRCWGTSTAASTDCVSAARTGMPT